MLQLIIGTAGTGKSTFVKEKIQSNARTDKKSIMIVPEQFSKTGETEIFSTLEKSQFGLVEVFSFTSLLRDVYTESGRALPPLLTDAGKAVMAKKSLQNVYKQLNSYGNQKNNTGFAFELARIFEDFKRNGISSTKLYDIAQKAPEANGKLKDVAQIYSEYCANIADGGADVEQMYLELAQNLPVSYTDSTEFFVDGFESFTYGQFAILSRIMEKAENVYIALTAADIFDRWNGTHPLSYTAQTATQLVNAAKKADVKVAKPVRLDTQYRFNNPTLCGIDKFILSETFDICGEETQQNAFVTSFANQFAEVSFVAAKITQLTKQGYSYDDIAVVCPQLDKYEHQLQESFTLAGIPYFIDQSRVILSSAPVVLFKNVLEIMDKGVNAATVMPLLKTQLTCFDSETVDLLENYLFIWQDQELSWKDGFSLPYGGITAGDSDKDKEILSNINTLVKGLYRVFAAAYNFGEENTAQDILSAMYSIIGDLKAEEILTQLITQTEDKEKSDLFVRQWECAVDCINQLYRICGSMVMRPRELQELFMLMVQGTKIGFAPQTQDCVMISTPQRMKIDAVKAVFVIGASQDIFPALVSDSSILSGADIQYLKDNQMELSADFSQRFAFENLYFYKTLTTAQEKLFISCAGRNIDSQEILSAEIEGIKKALNLKPANLELEDYCITPQFFTQYVGETMGADGAQILEKMGMEAPCTSQRSFEIQNKEYIKQLLGEHMVISPTASENYYKCPFGYFIRNLMHIYPLEKAQVSQREAGNYLHTVAQQVIQHYGENYGKTDWQEIANLTNSIVDKYLEENYPQKVRDSARFASLSNDMHTNALHLLQYIHSEQQSGSFRPVAFEKSIGFDSDIKPVTIKLDSGEKVSIVGVCDRIDVMHEKGKDYIRIVDYKTGTKKFSLEDVYNGLSSQLLLYMNSVLQSKSFGENPTPAAVIYQPSDAAFKFDKDDGLYTPVGMALGSEEISEGFDTKAEGRFGVIKGTEKIKSLSGSEVVDEKMFRAVLDFTKDKIKDMAKDVYNGNFANQPMDLGNERTSCEYCGYRVICREAGATKPRQKADFRIKEGNADGKTVD